MNTYNYFPNAILQPIYSHKLICSLFTTLFNSLLEKQNDCWFHACVLFCALMLWFESTVPGKLFEKP